MTAQCSILSRWRAKLVGDLTGDVLEIGVGTGENLRHYRAARHIWAIEPDAARAEQARRVACKTGVPVTVDLAAAEALPYEDDSFDHVVSSLVFCSVDDPRRAQAEIRRVLRPSGSFHAVEHVCPQNAAMAWLFRIVTPYWRRIACNCHLDRRTAEMLSGEGWNVTVHRRRLVFIRFTARPL